MLIATIFKIYSTVLNCLAILKQLQRDSAENGKKLDRILDAVEPLPAVRFIFRANLEGKIIEGATSTTMTNSQKLTLSVQPVDKRGDPASVEPGSAVWAIDDATLATVTASSDGLSADVAALGPQGSTRIVLSADADLGAGVVTIFGEYQLTVTAGAAVGFKITASEPVEQ